jgi:crossover junction endodeoxyribonuclease RuvC
MNTIMGIDPGKSGAAALVGNNEYIDHVDWTDGPSVAEKIREWKFKHGITYAVLERVHAMPKQGVSSTFSFGQNYGWWKGLLDSLGIAWTEATPQQWQKGVVPKRGNDNDKPSLTIARRMFPDAPLSRKKDHGRADALLIASWGYRAGFGK